MGVQGAGKRPEKTLQSILSRTPLFGKSRPRAEDATVGEGGGRHGPPARLLWAQLKINLSLTCADIGALMRNKLVVGKSTRSESVV